MCCAVLCCALLRRVQAAQALGGGVQLWRDSVLCYAAARSQMPGRGPADALEALQGGVALLEAASRCACSNVVHMQALFGLLHRSSMPAARCVPEW